LEESELALRELEKVYGQRAGEVWWEEAAQRPIYRYTGIGVEPVSSTKRSELASLKAWGEQKPVPEQGENGRRMLVPIRLRGHKIGSLVLRRDSEAAPWSSEENALVEDLSEQIGLALENARLMDETQRRAAREQALSQMTTRFSRFLDTDTVLQTAVRELGQLLEVDEVSVYVGDPEEDVQD
jgi:GAF domain-containing protein